MLEEWLDSTSKGFSNCKFYGSAPSLPLLPTSCPIQMQIVPSMFIKPLLLARQHLNITSLPNEHETFLHSYELILSEFSHKCNGRER